VAAAEAYDRAGRPDLDHLGRGRAPWGREGLVAVVAAERRALPFRQPVLPAEAAVVVAAGQRRFRPQGKARRRR